MRFYLPCPRLLLSCYSIGLTDTRGVGSSLITPVTDKFRDLDNSEEGETGAYELDQKGTAVLNVPDPRGRPEQFGDPGVGESFK